jgi:hypothetical protein
MGGYVFESIKNHKVNMQQNLVTFQDVIPFSMTHRGLASGAAHSADKVKREFLPTNQSAYSFSGNDEIEFHISGVKEMLIPSEVYFRCELTVDAYSNLGTSTVDPHVELEEGGIANLFRRIEITDRANRQIDVIDGYDRLSNIMSNIYMSPDHVDQNEWQSGDSKKNGVQDPFASGHFSAAPHLVSVATTGVATFGGTIQDVLPIGAQVIFYNANNRVVHRAYTIAHDGGDDAIVTVSPAPSVVLTSVRARLESNPRSVAAQTDGVTLNMRLDMGFFNISEDIPLFLLDGLIVKFFLREPRFALTGGLEGADKSLDYTINVPRMVCSLRTPSATVRARYLELFSSGMLNYTFPAYQTVSRQESGGSADIELDLPISKSSVRRVIFTVQNTLARGSTSSNDKHTDVYSYPSKTFIDGLLTSYQFKIGGKDYPQVRVNTDDILMTDAMNELQRAYNVHNNLNSKMRISFTDWGKFGLAPSTGAPSESRKALFSTSFATLENDPMSGLKTNGRGSDPHVICRLEASGAYMVNSVQASRYFDFYFEYTKILHLSANGIQVLD